LSVADEAIVPSVELPPATPFTSQVTAVLVEVFALLRLTVAVNSTTPPFGTLVDVGVIETDFTVVALLPPQDDKLKMPPTTTDERARKEFLLHTGVLWM
jgi:hypothetical protein